MDKRLELSEKQLDIVKRFNDVAQEMIDANIKAIYVGDQAGGSMYCINGNQVIDFLSQDDLNEYHEVEDESELTEEEAESEEPVYYEEVEVEFDEAYCLNCPVHFALSNDWDDTFGVRMKR